MTNEKQLIVSSVLEQGELNETEDGKLKKNPTTKFLLNFFSYTVISVS